MTFVGLPLNEHQALFHFRKGQLILMETVFEISESGLQAPDIVLHSGNRLPGLVVL